MQATVSSKWFGLGRAKKTALSIGMIGALVMGAATVGVMRDDAAPATVGGAEIAKPLSLAELTYIEQNTQLPELAAPVVIDYRFMEQNLYLPGDEVVPAVKDPFDPQFIEQNLNLPGRLPATSMDWRVIEQNAWGENVEVAPSITPFYFPDPDDASLEVGGIRIY